MRHDQSVSLGLSGVAALIYLQGLLCLHQVSLTTEYNIRVRDNDRL